MEVLLLQAVRIRAPITRMRTGTQVRQGPLQPLPSVLSEQPLAGLGLCILAQDELGESATGTPFLLLAQSPFPLHQLSPCRQQLLLKLQEPFLHLLLQATWALYFLTPLRQNLCPFQPDAGAISK